MQKYSNSYAGRGGQPIAGAAVLVKNLDGTAATIYSDNGKTVLAGLVTAKDGSFAFYAANGHLSITLSKTGLQDVTISDVLLFDPADSGASSFGFTQAGTGAITRSTQDKLRDVVSVKDFGAKGDGTTDDTASIQAALNSGATEVYVPPGAYLCSNILMPSTLWLVLRGAGSASRLMQKAGGAPILKWPTASIVYSQQRIESLMVDGTNGASHCIDTSGAGGLTMKDMYVNNVPTSYSGIYVNGANGTYVHDIRIKGLQVYSNTAGHSGMRFGPLVADTTVSDFIMNGNFTVQYCAYFDIGALTTRITDSHPYNAAQNVVYMGGNNDSCAFNSVVFDNATNDVMVVNNSKYVNFTDCWFEAIKSGKVGLRLISSSGISSANSRFDGAVGAVSAVSADVSSTDVRIVGGNVGQASNFTNIFDLAGARSYAAQVAGYNTYGMRFGFSGATTTAQAQSTTQYLGVNGGQAAINNTYYLVPEESVLTDFRVEVGATPAAGQTYTFNLQRNGATIGTATISNGSFGAAATLNQSVSRNDTIAIQSVFSATSGSTNLRYYARFAG